MTLASPVKKDASVTEQNPGCHAIYLLLLPEGKETHSGHLHDLEPHTRNITLSLTAATKTGNQDFVILVDEV